MSMTSLARFAALAVALVLCPALRAVTFNYDFTGSPNPGSVGNSLIFTPVAGGPTITATAWYLDTAGTLRQAALGIYANGLSVCSLGQICTNPNETDNSVYREFILLESSTLIDPFTVRLYDGGSSSDTDATYWLGGFNGQTQALNLTGATVAGLSALGFGSRNNDPGTDLCSGCFRSASLTPTGTGVTKLLFGAALTGDNNDSFLFTSLGANSVPEPSSILLFATAACGFLTILKRSRRSANGSHNP